MFVCSLWLLRKPTEHCIGHVASLTRQQPLPVAVLGRLSLPEELSVSNEVHEVLELMKKIDSINQLARRWLSKVCFIKFHVRMGPKHNGTHKSMRPVGPISDPGGHTQ